MGDEPMVLKGIELKCPNPECGDDTNLYRNEIMLRSVGVKPLEEGGWDWDNDCRDDAHWETSDRNPDEPEFYCRACDTYFDAPDMNELDGNADDPKPDRDTVRMGEGGSILVQPGLGPLMDEVNKSLKDTPADVYREVFMEIFMDVTTTLMAAQDGREVDGGELLMRTRDRIMKVMKIEPMTIPEET